VLFLVEETAIDEGYRGTDRLLEQRAKISAPALDRVFAKARDHVGSFSPKSTIAEALQYTLNQEAELRLFLTLRNLPIHNNASGRSESSLCFARTRSSWVTGRAARTSRCS
jgi:hypothetical protein